MTMRSRDMALPPTVVYAIMHVSGIRNGPKHTIFIDPHQLIDIGGLVISSEAWVSKA